MRQFFLEEELFDFENVKKGTLFRIEKSNYVCNLGEIVKARL